MDFKSKRRYIDRENNIDGTKSIKEKSYINTVDILRTCGSLRKVAGERALTLPQ